jgi:Protein of unknown function (DUF1566)
MKTLKTALLVALVSSMALWLVLTVACGDDDDDDSGGGDYYVPSGDDDDTADDDDDDGDDDTADDDDTESVDKTWTDPTSGLMWQTWTPDTWTPDTPRLETGTYAEAKEMCNGLIYANFGDWRLPSISELRSIVRGCPDTETGGACEVTDECSFHSNDCNIGDCDNCPEKDGPYTNNNCYWPKEIDILDASYGEQYGHNCDIYWSSTIAPNEPEYAWYLNFRSAEINLIKRLWILPFRCVRQASR